MNTRRQPQRGRLSEVTSCAAHDDKEVKFKSCRVERTLLLKEERASSAVSTSNLITQREATGLRHRGATAGTTGAGPSIGGGGMPAQLENSITVTLTAPAGPSC